MKKIPFILVGAGNFALQRLKILNETGKFIAVAIVDIDLKKAKKKNCRL
jgi:predicted dehydrogenase